MVLTLNVTSHTHTPLSGYLLSLQFFVGDIESMPFIEALRQLFFSTGKCSVIFHYMLSEIH